MKNELETTNEIAIDQISTFFNDGLKYISWNAELWDDVLNKNGMKVSQNYFGTIDYFNDHRNISAYKSVHELIVNENEPSLNFLHDRYWEEDFNKSVYMVIGLFCNFFKDSEDLSSDEINKTIEFILDKFKINKTNELIESIKNNSEKVLINSKK